jgi:hypothetical protein
MTQVTLIHGEYGNLQEGTYEVSTSDIDISSEGLRLGSLIEYFKSNGLRIENSMVLYWSKSRKIFVYVGNDPIDEEYTIPIHEIDPENIVLKCRQPVFTDIQQPVHLTRTSSGTEREKKVSRRTKERKIGFIVDKVRHWRSLYNGQPDNTGEIVKKNLEDAAKEVGISKKSLDDYLLQIRFGKKFGFNF